MLNKGNESDLVTEKLSDMHYCFLKCQLMLSERERFISERSYGSERSTTDANILRVFRLKLHYIA